MNKVYAETMKAFFSSITKETLNNSEALAIAYANFFWNQDSHLYSLYSKMEYGKYSGARLIQLPDTSSLTNVNLVNNKTQLSYITKRGLLISDTIVFSHYKEKEHCFFTYDDQPPNPGIDSMHNQCYLRCPSLDEFGGWLKGCKKLLLNGDVFYYPDIKISIERETSSWGSTYWDEEVTMDKIRDIVLNQETLIDTASKAFRENLYLRYITEVEIPYIDNVNIDTLSEIILEEKENIDKSRDYLRNNFIDLRLANNSENYDGKIEQIGLSIKDCIREVESHFKRIKRKRTFQVSGAVVGTVTASLVAINGATLNILPAIIGAGGGIIALANYIENYLTEKQKGKEMPFYYIWLISKKQ